MLIISMYVDDKFMPQIGSFQFLLQIKFSCILYNKNKKCFHDPTPVKVKLKSDD